jgi:enoyl-CoA hydratase/carnithine racemase
MSDGLSIRRAGDALVVAFARPEKKNAITRPMLAALDAAIARARDERGLRALIITGEGGSFSAGLDGELVRELTASMPTPELVRATLGGLQRHFGQLESLPLPVIAAVEGVCLGAGFELALACDLRVGSSASQYGFPEMRLGFLPDLGGTSRLTRQLGTARAKTWLLTGRSFPAARAYEQGILLEVTPPGQALQAALHLAEEITRCAPLALAACKRTVEGVAGAPLARALELEQEAMAELLATDDLREGVAAFAERRAPKWSGR